MKLQKRIWMKRLLYGHVENHSKIFQNVNMTKTRKKNEEEKNITNSKKN